MYAWLGKHLRLPDRPYEYVGKLFIGFTVSRTGYVRDIDIVRIQGRDRAAMKRYLVSVIEKMPRWKPGFHKGKPVSVRYHLPINLEPE
ncbi:energy transducer TonB [Fibrella arboris]|uniref:energy transducer TonB n=1 Tax=Fibrella arboris TaxID=3242486 RepID=UPI003520A141